MGIKIIKDLSEVSAEELKQMVLAFVVDSNPQGIDHIGLAQMTIENMTKSFNDVTYQHNLWILKNGDKTQGFALTNISKDIDNSKCFYIYAGYLDPIVRNTGIAKEGLRILKQFGRVMGCKYSVVVAGRNPKAYKRFLGKDTEEYCTLFKELL